MTSYISVKSYCFISFGLSLLTVSSFYNSNQRQFYPTVVDLASSKSARIVLGNFFIVIVGLIGLLLKYLFFGKLRDVEVAFLTENFSSSAMDVLLEVAMFRDDFDQKFVVWFVCLQFVKTFHWILLKRLEFLGQLERQPFLIYLKYNTFLHILTFCDGFLSLTFGYAYFRSLGPPITILFAYEYSLLLISILVMGAKHMFTLYSFIYYNGQWQNKSTLSLYVDFLGDLCQLVLYILFFLSIHTLFGFPFYLVRHTLVTFSSFTKRLSNLIKYRKATRQIDRFHDANVEELALCHNTCTICRGNMDEGKKLPCGHVFHQACLREWFEHQQNCPLCRVYVLDTNIRPNMPQEIPEERRQQ